MFYLLNSDRQPYEVHQHTFSAANFFNPANKSRIVAQEDVGEAWVSTVFLGMKHGEGSDGRPLLFETFVIHKPDDDSNVVRRYATWEEAEAGHAEIKEQIRLWFEGRLPGPPKTIEQ